VLSGMACPDCNSSDPATRRDNLLRLPPDFKIDTEMDRGIDVSQPAPALRTPT
jgi:hypothetical protein